MHVCAHVDVCVCVHVCPFVCMCMSVQVYACVHVFVCMCVCVCAGVFVCASMCVCVCVFVVHCMLQLQKFKFSICTLINMKARVAVNAVCDIWVAETVCLDGVEGASDVNVTCSTGDAAQN